MHSFRNVEKVCDSISVFYCSWFFLIFREDKRNDTQAKITELNESEYHVISLQDIFFSPLFLETLFHYILQKTCHKYVNHLALDLM